MKKASTKPKGATSYKETAFGIIPHSKLIKLELEGTKKGLEYLHNLILRDSNIRITPTLICLIHEVSFGWIFPEWAGKYRKIRVMFSGREAPSFYQIPEFIINLCHDLEERLKHLPNLESMDFIVKVVELLAWFQHRFVFIHPFQDYNGRTTRMLTILILLKLNLPPLELKAETGEDRKTYIKAMQKADSGNFSFLEELLSQALTEGLNQIGKQKLKG